MNHEKVSKLKKQIAEANNIIFEISLELKNPKNINLSIEERNYIQTLSNKCQLQIIFMEAELSLCQMELV